MIPFKAQPQTAQSAWGKGSILWNGRLPSGVLGRPEWNRIEPEAFETGAVQ
jgi:hypothetical protein